MPWQDGIVSSTTKQITCILSSFPLLRLQLIWFPSTLTIYFVFVCGVIRKKRFFRDISSASKWRFIDKLNIFIDFLYHFLYVRFHLQVANNPCSTLLTAHFRLDGHPHVSPLHRVIQGSAQTYFFFERSQVNVYTYNWPTSCWAEYALFFASIFNRTFLYYKFIGSVSMLNTYKLAHKIRLLYFTMIANFGFFNVKNFEIRVCITLYSFKSTMPTFCG